MKNAKILVIAAALFSTVAFAAIGNIWLQPGLMKGGLFIGSSAAATAAESDGSGGANCGLAPSTDDCGAAPGTIAGRSSVA